MTGDTPSKTLPGWAIILALTTLAYSTTFTNPFIFDDGPHVVNNPAIKGLFPPWDFWLTANPHPRPTLYLTLALNFALSGLHTWSYHLLSFAVHLGAALALWGVLRRTFQHAQVCTPLRDQAHTLALVGALIFALHPLQTEAVSYVVHRGESLVGLFTLVLFYGFLRHQESPHKKWLALMWGAALLGMGSKEVMAVVPLLVLLFDRAFFAGSLGSALSKRKIMYAGLFGTWVFLGAMLFYHFAYLEAYVPTTHETDIPLLLNEVPTPITYAASETGVLWHYLRTFFWPTGLCGDYLWPVATHWKQVIGPITGMLLLGLATLWTFFKKPAWSFVGCWFFLVLGPTSSFKVLPDLAADRRMYLPLAVLAAALTVGLWKVLALKIKNPKTRQDVFTKVGTVLILVLAFTTYHRNSVYENSVVYWQDVIKVSPQNPRAHNNLGAALLDQDKTQLALLHLQKAVDLNPNYADPLLNMAAVFEKENNWVSAATWYQKVLNRWPNQYKALSGIGVAYDRQGKFDKAMAHFHKAQTLRSTDPGLYNDMGVSLCRQRKFGQALPYFKKALTLDPLFEKAQKNLEAAKRDLAQSQAP